MGSFPLARDLLHLVRRQHRIHGIIPARAGFTGQAGLAKIDALDHPRSRGVYAGRITSNLERPGSSPLARGLRRSTTAVRKEAGIIPARAGFTYVYVSKLGAMQDHPRSRGVYLLIGSTAARHSGSSPLARGLLSTDLLDRKTVGIIPARAGFTGRSRRSRASAPDHPRSRGVYWLFVFGGVVGGAYRLVEVVVVRWSLRRPVWMRLRMV